MTLFPSVVVPAIPPRPPQLSLMNSAIRPDSGSDPSSSAPTAEQLAALPAGLRAELADRAGEMWTRGFSYAPESHAAIENRDGCDFTSVDLPSIPAPTGLAATPSAAGGTMASGTYAYQVTAVNANGETTALAATTVVVVGPSGSVALTWNKANETATYNIYGRVGGSIGKIGTVGPFDDDQATAFVDTGAAAVGAAPPSSNTTGGPGSYTNPAINIVVPWLLVAEDGCSTFGFSERDYKGRALRLLENAKHQAIGREFWTGALATAKGYPNRFLTDANLVDLTAGTPVSIARGLQLLQDALTQCGFGGQGMIHVQPQTTGDLLRVRRVGNQLLDPFDNFIIPDPGYNGVASGITGTTTGTAVMIASDLVMVREEDEGTVFPDTFQEALDWGQAGSPNSLRFRAEKFGAAYFDGACQFGVRVTLTT